MNTKNIFLLIIISLVFYRFVDLIIKSHENIRNKVRQINNSPFFLFLINVQLIKFLVFKFSRWFNRRYQHPFKKLNKIQRNSFETFQNT